eukprot:NODE_361_length_8796_cov_0.460274.p6 type:complete len:155 gc:universal NODE_361_length_8796_cov_0.460274:8267-8731(+)
MWYVQNSVLSNHYCYERINKMINFITINGYCGYAIKYHFRRYEFQQRGTVHCHLLLWLNDTNVSSEMLFTDLLNSISGHIPDYNDDPMLFYVVNRYQRHSHGAYCTSNGTSRYRFNYPKIVSSESFFDFQNFRYVLKRSAADVMIKSYNSKNMG